MSGAARSMVTPSRRGAATVALACVAALLAATPAAGAGDEIEPNNRRGNAQVLTLPVYTDEYQEFVGSIHTPGDVDWYAFNAPAGHVISVSTSRAGYAGHFRSVLRLYTPSGRVLDARDANGNTLAGYARTSGRYYLRVAHASRTVSGERYGLEISTYPYPSDQAGWNPTPLYPGQRYTLRVGDNPPEPVSVEIADVVGSPLRDVLVSTWVGAQGRPALYYLESSSGGVLGRPRRILMRPPAAHPFAMTLGVTAGDVVRDSRSEVMLGRYEGVQLFVQRDGRLRKGALLRTPYAVNTIAVIDFDRDGRRDVVANTYRGVLLIRRTARGFARPRRVLPYALRHLQVADVVGDARPDLIGTRGDDYVRVYRQRATGSFAPATLLRARAADMTFLPRGLVVADVTGDGRRDIVVEHDWNRDTINVFARTRNGWSHPRISTLWGESAIREAVDFNGDGRPELATGSEIVYLDDAGYVRRTLDFPGVDYAWWDDGLAARDLSGDGRPDLLLADTDGPHVFRGGFTP